MKHIANILTNSKIDDNELFNVVRKKSDIEQTIPTLVVGWEMVKTWFGEDVSTIDWRISDNIYWTFGCRERRDRNEHDTLNFKRIAVNKFVETIKYKFINIFNLTREEKINIVNRIKTSQHGTFYFYNDVIYLTLDENVVIGFSLKDIDYCGCDRKKFLSIIYGNKNLIQVTNEMVTMTIRKTFISTVYVIPALFF